MTDTTPPHPTLFFGDGTPHITPRHTVSHLLEMVHGGELVVPEALVCTFFPRLTELLAAERGAAVDDRLTALGGRELQLHRLSDNVALHTLPMGAPAAVMQVEVFIALGVKRLVLVGAAGSLNQEVRIGHATVPRTAIREEGTSHHYAPPEFVARADHQLATMLAQQGRAAGVTVAEGHHWTVDAPYRELTEKVRRHASLGALSVDMEVSALYVVAELRGVACAAILAISDELHQEEWVQDFRGPGYQDTLKAIGEAAIATAERTHLG